MPSQRRRVNWIFRTQGTARDPFSGKEIRSADVGEFSIPTIGGMVLDETNGRPVLTGWRFADPDAAIEALDRAGFSFVAYVHYRSSF